LKRVEALWGKPYRRGYILWLPPLSRTLIMSDYVEYGKVVVSTKDFRQAIASIGTQDILIRVNGGLELQPVERYFVPNPKYPGRVCAHRLARNSIPYYVKPTRQKLDGVGVILQIKIRQYCRKRS
jgi:hypothetical protein